MSVALGQKNNVHQSEEDASQLPVFQRHDPREYVVAHAIILSWFHGHPGITERSFVVNMLVVSRSAVHTPVPGNAALFLLRTTIPRSRAMYPFIKP